MSVHSSFSFKKFLSLRQTYYKYTIVFVSIRSLSSAVSYCSTYPEFVAECLTLSTVATLFN